jgi:hypothetical protein
LYVIFPECIENGLPVDACEARERLIEKLRRGGFGWEPCRIFRFENDPADYCGSIFIDVPYCEREPRYREVASWFDSICGVREMDGADLCILSIERAKGSENGLVT